MNDIKNEFFFGTQNTHRAWSEGADIAHIAWNGDVAPEDVTAGAKIFELVPNGQKGFILVIHVQGQRDFHPEARKRITTDPRSKWARAVLVVGASFQARVLFGMVTKALHVLNRQAAHMSFLASEAEVPAHIAALRKQHPELLV